MKVYQSRDLTAPPIYEFGEFRLDATKRLLCRSDGSLVPLTHRVFETLLYLVQHGGEILPRERLMDAIWPDAVVEENNLTQNVSTLRRVLGQTPGSNEFIVTVPGHGYRFVQEVRQSANGSPPAAVEASVAAPAVDFAAAPGRRFLALAGAVLLLLALCVGFFIFKHDRTQTRTLNPTGTLPASRAIPEKSIAVLPFANLSSDPENIYFADGMKDEILTRLSKVAALKVISRTSTDKYKNAPDNLREIAQQLGVAYILEGSARRAGEAVRVTVQLIHAPSDTHLWAETYDRKLTDMFQVESEVAQRIATALAATLSGSESRALEQTPTANVEAHEAYLKGRYFWNKRTVAGYKQAAAHFDRAIDQDPGYAQAYAGLADALLFLGGENGPDQKETVAKGRAALSKALGLDETLADAHASLGLVAMNFDWDWVAAEREFKRAIELNPNYATAHQWYGEFLADMGRFEEGISEIKRARELDPLSLVINTDTGKVYTIARRYDEAIKQYQRVLEMDPDFAVARGLMALTYSFSKHHEEALAEARQIDGMENGAMYLGWLGYIYGAAGRKNEAENVVNRLRDLATQTYVSPIWCTCVYAGLGEKDEAFEGFEKVMAERAAGGAVALRCSPIYDSLRSDPRFADLLHRANLVP